MMASYEPVPILASRLTLKVAVFSALMIVSAVVLHRLAGMGTPIALTLMGSGVVGAGAAVLLAILAITQIWRRHTLGAAHVATGLAISAAIFAWPAVYARSYMKYPAIADVTTDMRAPPAFLQLARDRGLAANSVNYPGGEVAARQSEAYPDLRTFAMERSAEEAFEIVRDAFKRLKLQIVAESLPTEGRRQVEGIIEAVDRTMLVGFYDDIVVRVRGDDR